MYYYKKMYLKLLRASEEAIQKIIEAQKECEELYLSNTSSECQIISLLEDKNHTTDKT